MPRLLAGCIVLAMFAALVAARVRAAGEDATGVDVTDFIAADAARNAARWNDPEYRAAVLARERTQLPQQYPGLVEQLGPTPEEADALFDLLAEIQTDKFSANARIQFIPGQPGAVAAVQELMRTRQEIQRKRDESLEVLLGGARFAQFRDYEQEAPARSRADALARALEAAGHPLGREQSRPFVAALIAEEKLRMEFRQAMTAERRPDGPMDQSLMDAENLRFQTDSTRRLLEALQPQLDAGQFDTLRNLLEQQLAVRRAALRIDSKTP